MANHLITGAAGFIGFRLSEVLLLQSHTDTGVDHMNDADALRWTGTRETIKP